MEIEAPIKQVWDVPAATEHYGEWIPFTTRVATELNVGSPAKLQVVLAPLNQKQVERIDLANPPHTLVWGTELGHRFLLVAQPIQRLEALCADRCPYATTIALSRLLAPLVVLQFGRCIRRGFDATAVALKARAQTAAEV